MRPRSPRRRRRGREESQHMSCAHRVRRVRRIWKLRIQATRPRPRRRRAWTASAASGRAASPVARLCGARAWRRPCLLIRRASAASPACRRSSRSRSFASGSQLVTAAWGASRTSDSAVIPKISKGKNLRLRARVGHSALLLGVPTSQVRVENGRRLARYESFADKFAGMLVSLWAAS